MNFIGSKMKGLFEYGDITESRWAYWKNQNIFRFNFFRSNLGSSTLDVETERSGIVSANASVRRRRRCIWIGSIVSGLVAIIIIAATVKSRSKKHFLVLIMSTFSVKGINYKLLQKLLLQMQQMMIPLRYWTPPPNWTLIAPGDAQIKTKGWKQWNI